MDDYSPAPIAPPLDIDLPDEEEVLTTETIQLADSYHHPAWEAVERIFTEKIEIFKYGCTDAQRPASEYKIEDLAYKIVASQLTEVLMGIKDAVSAAESIKREEGGK